MVLASHVNWPCDLPYLLCPSKEISAEHTPLYNLSRGPLAGGAVCKFGGGCFGTVLIFLLLYRLLGS